VVILCGTPILAVGLDGWGTGVCGGGGIGKGKDRSIRVWVGRVRWLEVQGRARIGVDQCGMTNQKSRDGGATSVGL
jgi:hypothetical protein